MFQGHRRTRGVSLHPHTWSVLGTISACRKALSAAYQADCRNIWYKVADGNTLDCEPPKICRVRDRVDERLGGGEELRNLGGGGEHVPKWCAPPPPFRTNDPRPLIS